MDEILFIAFLSCLIFIPLLFIIYKWFWKKRHLKNILFGLLVFTTVDFSYTVYRAIYPGDNFYIKEFKDNSKVQFPSSGKIINSDASYPDIHGHYFAAALIQFSKADYVNLKNRVSSDTDFSKTYQPIGESDQIRKILRGLPHEDIEIIFMKRMKPESEYLFKIGFCRKNRVVILRGEDE